MRILHLGDNAPQHSSYHRYSALRRLGHEVVQINPEAVIGRGWFGRALHYRTGYLLAARAVRQHVMRTIGDSAFDLVWVDGGHVVPVQLLRDLRTRARWLVNYNLDDPTGARDGRRWLSFRRAIPAYDLLAVVRKENIAEYQARGARRVLRVFRSYDPVAHAPLALTAAEWDAWSTEVAFVGTWMPERGPFLSRLLELGVPLAILGDSWHKAREWPRLRPFVRPGPYGRDYVAAVQCARIALGLLSKGNRDLHTQRSSEIPFIGGLLCAERTVEHEAMFTADREAVLWSTAEECAAKCRALLADEASRQAIAAAGRVRIIASGLSNDAVLAHILETTTTVAISRK
jgi:spore maturation protein CgeB